MDKGLDKIINVCYNYILIRELARIELSLKKALEIVTMRNISFVLALIAVTMCFAGCGHKSIYSQEWVVVSSSPMTVDLKDLMMFLLVLAGSALVITICVMLFRGSKSESELEEALIPKDFVDKAITVGNHSWVPINCIGGDYEDLTNDDAKLILGVLSEFEQAHPELEVVGWKQELKHESHYRYFYIFGIWIDHKAKPGFEEEIKTQ